MIPAAGMILENNLKIKDLSVIWKAQVWSRVLWFYCLPDLATTLLTSAADRMHSQMDLSYRLGWRNLRRKSGLSMESSKWWEELVKRERFKVTCSSQTYLTKSHLRKWGCWPEKEDCQQGWGTQTWPDPDELFRVLSLTTLTSRASHLQFHHPTWQVPALSKHESFWNVGFYFSWKWSLGLCSTLISFNLKNLQETELYFSYQSKCLNSGSTEKQSKRGWCYLLE